MDILIYCIKLLVYLLLIVISGDVLVNSFVPSTVSLQRQERLHKGMKQLANVLLLVIVLAIFVQIISWTQQLEPELNQLISMLLEEATGRAWLALFVSSLLFSLLSSKYFMARIVLVLAMLLAESFNGHAAGNSVLVLFDFVHLSAVSIWVGGVISFCWHSRESKEVAISFLKNYAKLLWLTIAIVSASGLIMALNILPSWYYLLYTSWGIILILKIAAVLLALWLGYKAKNKLTHYAANQREQTNKAQLLRPILMEFAVLLVVIAFAALIGMLSPMPSGEKALNYHQMGEELHYTIKLYPNAPGPNDVSLSLWTLKEEGEIESVELSLQALEKQKAVPRVFQLEAAQLDDDFEFPGFNESRYTLAGLTLPYPGKWQAEVTITFTDGRERQFSLEFDN